MIEVKDYLKTLNQEGVKNYFNLRGFDIEIVDSSKSLIYKIGGVEGVEIEIGSNELKITYLKLHSLLVIYFLTVFFCTNYEGVDLFVNKKKFHLSTLSLFEKWQEDVKIFLMEDLENNPITILVSNVEFQIIEDLSHTLVFCIFPEYDDDYFWTKEEKKRVK